MKPLLTVCLIVTAALSLNDGASAQDKYPVNVIVPQAAGGGNDAIARIVGHR